MSAPESAEPTPAGPTPVDSGPPLAITVAPNGARRGKADHPALPITPEDMAAEAPRWRDGGAAMLHLHVRDQEGKHSLDPGRYRESIAAVREAVGQDLVIQATSEAAGIFTAEEQIAAIRALQPEAVSMAVRELFPRGTETAPARDFLAWCREAEVSVQFILYDSDDLLRFYELRNERAIPAYRSFLLYVLGRYTGGQVAAPFELLPFLQETDPALERDPWAVCAFGPRESACTMAAAALGGHVRVGFENNLHLPGGAVAADNTALVAAAADGARAIGRPLADAAALRQWMRDWAGQELGA